MGTTDAACPAPNGEGQSGTPLRETVRTRSIDRLPRFVRDSALLELFYVRLPRWLDTGLPLLGDAFGDGVWTVIWRPVAAYLPLAALLIGCVAPFFAKAITNVYTDSLLLIAITVAGAILTGTFGVTLLAGYVFGSFVVAFARVDVWSVAEVLRLITKLLVSDLAMAIPTLLIPRVAHAFVPPAPPQLAGRPGVKLAMRAVLYALSCALLVFVWCRGLATLVRPVATLSQGRESQAVAPISWNWVTVVVITAIAAFVRIMLEERLSQSANASVVTDLKRRRWIGHQRVRIFSRLPKPVRVLWSSGLAALQLAGTFERWFDALAVLGVLAGILTSRTRLLRRIPARWMATITKMPMLLRFTLALAGGYLLSSVVMRLLWTTASMRAVTLSTLLSLTLFTLLFPAQPQPLASPRIETEQAVASGSFAAIAALAVGWGFQARAQIAVAQAAAGYLSAFGNPGCGGLHDCYRDPSSAAVTASGIAAVISVVVPQMLGVFALERPPLEYAADEGPLAHDTRAAAVGTDAQHVIDALRHAVQQASSGPLKGVLEVVGSVRDARTLFGKFAQPGKIRPHTNLALRAAGGYIAEIPGGGIVGFRPFSKSGPPVIDLHGVPGFEWVREFKFLT
jgi:hypothetical protein